MSHGEATRLIAVRHGETAWNVEARLQGQLDIPLNERGLEQARRTAHWLAEDSPDVVVSSDLARARATAQAITNFNRIPLELDPGLRERSFGSFQGMTHIEVAERWPELSRQTSGRSPLARRVLTLSCLPDGVPAAVKRRARTWGAVPGKPMPFGSRFIQTTRNPPSFIGATAGRKSAGGVGAGASTFTLKAGPRGAPLAWNL